jgi:hypothetical protein
VLKAALEDANYLLDTGYWVHIQALEYDSIEPVSMEVGKVNSEGVREQCQVTMIYYFDHERSEVRVSKRLHS